MLTKTEYDNIFRYFDKNCDDEVSFNEFIAFLRSTSFKKIKFNSTTSSA